MTVITETPAPQRTELRDEYYLHALAWANEERMARGLKPLTDLPQGTPGQANGCPLAYALGRTVPTKNPVAHVTTFIRRFDKGRYGWLIER